MTELECQIHEEISARGPMPFARFMELALYDPVLGYYSRARDPFGAGGDYFTSSQLQPVSGRLLARRIAAWKSELGDPEDFTVVELGAGRGETAREIRNRLPNIRYIEVELDRGALPDRFTGVVFSNEFFDALPVHVVRRSESGLKEAFVSAQGERLVWLEGPPSSPALERYVERFAPTLTPEQTLEVNLQALEWLDRSARSLQRGFVLTIDYGYTAEEISAGRFPDGSLMSYRRHLALNNILAEPGERDITAHVNFTALSTYGESLGLRSAPLQTQAQFLLSIGQTDEFRSALQADNEQQAQQNRLKLKMLLFGMGETFRVLVQERVDHKP